MWVSVFAYFLARFHALGRTHWTKFGETFSKKLTQLFLLTAHELFALIQTSSISLKLAAGPVRKL
jgi:hypothetical protein